MAERLLNSLIGHEKIPFLSKFKAIANVIETVINIISDIPIQINRCLTEIQQKISSFENRLTTLGNTITQIRNMEEDNIPNSNSNIPVTLRGAIMGELRDLFGRWTNASSSNDKENKKRKCWNCKRTLSFMEFSARNPDKDANWLTNLWNHPLIEIYCCSCYEKFEKEEKETKLIEDSKIVRNRLVDEEREGLIFLERKLNKHIVVTDELKFDFRGHFRFRGYPCEFKEKDGHVIGLKLSNSRLTSVPVEIQLFSELEELDLSYNLLNQIPEWLASFSSLKILDLNYNNSIEIPELVLKRKKLIILPQKARTRNPMIRVINEIKEKIGIQIPIRF